MQPGAKKPRPVMALLDLLGRRWTLRVLWELRGDDIPTFRELQERCGGMSSSVLSQRIAELREAGIVAPGANALTKDGRELLELLTPVNEWADRWARRSM